MNLQKKIHNPQALDDNRRSSYMINPVLRKFIPQISTIKFQIVILIFLAVTEYVFVVVNVGHSNLFQFLIFFSIDTLFFLIIVHFVLPKLALCQSSLILILSIVLMVMFLHTMLYLIVYSLFTNNSMAFMSKLEPKFMINPFYRSWQRFIFSLLFWSAYEIKNSAKREQVLESNILYSRISPHLLFNALNMLPSGTTTPVKNEKVIELISRYTRNAMMELGEDGKGILTGELEQLETLLQINELRFEKIYVHLQLDLPDDITAYRIPPQIIVTLAENIFKYGIVDDPLKPAAIKLSLNDHFLTVRMSNYVYPIQEHPSGKLGLNSVQKRLINIYGNNHHFKVYETRGVFSVEMGFQV